MTDRAGGGQIAFLLAQLGGLAGIRFAERIQLLAVTPPQAGVLRAVGSGPGRSQQALSAQLGVAPSRLVALIDDLERGGLVERRRDPQDRRYHAIHLTDEGERRLQEIGRAAQAHGHDLLRPLSDRDRDVLGEILTRLAEAHGMAPGVHPGLGQHGTTEGPPRQARSHGRPK
ncbi:MAG: MarR family winged helix-turn-helix transcriptional regulator [Actinomycetota bacterium]|nr:MarR family winged helix-turn-helix transcriptional regulator [Actinomycetota bacterium]